MLAKFENKISSSYEINSWKPGPTSFYLLLKKWDLLPRECIVIEDNVPRVIAIVKGGSALMDMQVEVILIKLLNAGAITFNSLKSVQRTY